MAILGYLKEMLILEDDASMSDVNSEVSDTEADPIVDEDSLASDIIVDKIDTIIKSVFPDAMSDVKFNGDLIPSIDIDFAIDDTTDHQKFQITGGFDKDGNIVGSFQLEPNKYGGYYVKNTSDIQLRKKSGSINDILEYLKGYFHDLKIDKLEKDDAIKSNDGDVTNEEN